MTAVSRTTRLDDPDRLRALHRLRIAGTAQEAVWQDVAELVRAVAEAPIGAVSFVDEEQTWFKALSGADAIASLPRDVTGCAHVVETGQPLVVPDIADSPVFEGNPVRGLIRWYAGYPVADEDGHVLGAVCAMDTVVRHDEAAVLERLSAVATGLLRARLARPGLSAALRSRRPA